MHLNKLKLTNFKNYEQQEIACSPHINCFVGLNGMGKTNLLDAIYYICMGKSHTGLSDSHLLKHQADFFRIEAVITKFEKTDKVVAKVVPRKLKEMELNAILYKKIADHIGAFPVVMIAPDDTELIMDGSEVRRRFLDNTLSQLDSTYLEALLLYNKILQQRNAALKHFAETKSFNPNLLDTYNHQLLEPGKRIFERRLDFMEAFNAIFQQKYAYISNSSELVDCQYDSQLHQKDFSTLLQGTMDKDRILQRTTAGIHKDDLLIKIGGYPAKNFSSQGQLKSLALALKLAQHELLHQKKKLQPLLLLDDIFDKLDKTRVQRLLNLLLEKSSGQIFITDTDEQRTEEMVRRLEMPYQIFQIENGKAISLFPN